jgi:hypothetical protein
MLDEDDVLVSARGRDRIPDALERRLVVGGLDRDLERAGRIGLADDGIGQRATQLCVRSLGALAALTHLHANNLSSAHETGLAWVESVEVV